MQSKGEIKPKPLTLTHSHKWKEVIILFYSQYGTRCRVGFAASIVITTTVNRKMAAKLTSELYYNISVVCCYCCCCCCRHCCCKEYLSFYFFARLNLICRHSKRNRIMAHQPAFRLLVVFSHNHFYSAFSYEVHEWFGLKLQSQVLRFPKVVKKNVFVYSILYSIFCKTM